MTNRERFKPGVNLELNRAFSVDELRTEQVRHLYALAPIGFVATVVNAPIVFFIMKGVTPYKLLVPWLLTILVVTALRMGLVLWFRSSRLEPATAGLWQKRFLVSLAVTGAVWGSLGLLPFADMPLDHQVFVSLVLCGMAAGATSTFAMTRYGFAAYGFPSLTPLGLHLFLMKDNFHYAMGVMLVLYGVLLWRISRHNHKVNVASLALRFENRAMIEGLQQAKGDMEELNRQLRGEIEARWKAEATLRANHLRLEAMVAERTADLSIANEQLRAARDAAEAASQAKSEFLANMSHEMRTPLAGALGMIKLVLEMDIGVEERQLLKMAERSTESLLRIIADVLDFSRLESGVMSFEKSPFSIRDVVETAVEVVSFHAREKGITISWQVDDALPERVLGDAGRTRQVLVNLLGNAVKFTEKGGIQVSVTPWEILEEPGRECLLCTVRDTGVGIAADKLEKIFNKFTQIDSSLTRRYGGTGLGLALTRQIVEKMGGRIWAASTVGVGSTFYFTLPDG